MIIVIVINSTIVVYFVGPFFFSTPKSSNRLSFVLNTRKDNHRELTTTNFRSSSLRSKQFALALKEFTGVDDYFGGFFGVKVNHYKRINFDKTDIFRSSSAETRTRRCRKT